MTITEIEAEAKKIADNIEHNITKGGYLPLESEWLTMMSLARMIEALATAMKQC